MPGSSSRLSGRIPARTQAKPVASSESASAAQPETRSGWPFRAAPCPAAAAYSSFSRGGVDDSGHGFSLLLQCDGDRVVRETVDEVDGAVDRVDHPAVLTGPGGFAALFAENAVIRKALPDPAGQVRFDLAVGLSHQIRRRPFHVDFGGGQAAAAFHCDFSRLHCDFADKAEHFPAPLFRVYQLINQNVLTCGGNPSACP